MALDHYVSQVHLKQFTSPTLGNLLYAIRKKDLSLFTPKTRDICRIAEGNTNAYLKENRIIEEFLKTIEPKYDASLNKLHNDNIDTECIYTIAGFVAYVNSCSPASMRHHSAMLQSQIEARCVSIDTQGLFPPPPPHLGGLNLTELLQHRLVYADSDPKFSQAIGISSILRNLDLLGNFQWEILINQFEDSAYFTSDYPIAIEASMDPDVLNKIVPLSPSLAIRILPNRKIHPGQVTYNFSNFTHRRRRLARKEVTHINRLIVRCAEELVCFRDKHPWVIGFVKKNRKYSIGLRHQVPCGTETVVPCRQEIVETLD